MPRPIIGVDASRVSDRQPTGTETYASQIVRSLLRLPSDVAFRIYTNTEAPPSWTPSGVEVRSIPFPRFWTQVRLSVEMLRNPPDLLFVPAHVIPFKHPTSVVTIHDLGYLHHPESHPKRQRVVLDRTTRWSARAAAHIIVPSESTAADLTHYLGIPPARISPVLHGVGPEFSPSSSYDVARVRADYALMRRYILAVGTMHPRKNYGRLAEAVRALVADGFDLDLVIAGKRGWLAHEVECELAATGLERRLRILSYVPSEDLPALYSGATAFAMPSLYEGFGLPLLEAMACGVPTVAADRSSLPEIAGAASLLVDPFDSSALARALRAVIEQPVLAERLRDAGRARASEFTWDAAARRTMSIFNGVINERTKSERHS